MRLWSEISFFLVLDCFEFSFLLGEWKHLNTQSFWYDLWVRGNESFAYYAEYDGTLTTLDSFTLFINNEHNIDLSALDPDPAVLYCAVANMNTSPGTYGFSYDWVDCDNLDIKALRLCFKPPYPSCTTGAGLRKKRNIEESYNENAAIIDDDETNKLEDQLKTNAIDPPLPPIVAQPPTVAPPQPPTAAPPQTPTAAPPPQPPTPTEPEATLDDVFVESKKMEKKEKAKQARLAFQTNFKVRSLQNPYLYIL